MNGSGINSNNEPLSNFQLDDKLKDVKGYLGCFSRDEIPTLKPGQSIIINLEPHTESGSHWVCLICRPNNNIYLDSFGVAPPEEVLKLRPGKTLYNAQQYQELTSSRCGMFCAYFISEIEGKHKNPLDVLYSLDMGPSNHNEEVVSRAYKQL